MLRTEEGEPVSKRQEVKRVIQLIELVTRILVDVVHKEEEGREATEAGAADAVASALHAKDGQVFGVRAAMTIAELVAADPAAWVGLIARISRRSETREVGSWVLAASVQAVLEERGQAPSDHSSHPASYSTTT